MGGFFLIPKKGTGGGAEAIPLIVTCSSQFAGTTITASDGTSTLTETCPSTSPYEVTFILPNDGSWTISGTASGQTFTTSILIEPYETTLNAIPEGSTVLPTDDIQTWLKCAGIFDKSYTTISEVLNDATTVTTLIASNNAADYMARSTTWASSVVADSSAMTKIGANDYCAEALLDNSTWLAAICDSTYFESVLTSKVPTMTSATAPSGTVSASNNVSDAGLGGYAFKAFDNNDSTIWLPNTSTSEYIGYEFTSPIKISLATLKGMENVSGKEAKYTIQGYDGSNWIDLSSEQIYTIAMGQSRMVQNTQIIAGQKYSKYQIQFSTQIRQVNVGAMYPIQIQFYGRA